MSKRSGRRSARAGAGAAPAAGAAAEVAQVTEASAGSGAAHNPTPGSPGTLAAAGAAGREAKPDAPQRSRGDGGVSAPAGADLRIEYARLSDLVGAPRNPKGHDLGALSASLDEFGYVAPVILNEGTGRYVVGHGRVDLLRQLRAAGKAPPARVRVAPDGEWEVPVVRGIRFRSDAEAERYLLADNRVQQLGGWERAELAEVLKDLAATGGLGGTGFTGDDLDDILRDLGEVPGPRERDAGQGAGTLAARFLVPPFSVLDARQGYWTERKRQWVAAGALPEESVAAAASAIPRRATSSSRTDTARRISEPGISGDFSVFDPVLAELVVRWFCPPGGRVLDPFAGSSVGGVVAGTLGRQYVGVELRADQVEANRRQWTRVERRPPRFAPDPQSAPEAGDAYPDAPTPVEEVRVPIAHEVTRDGAVEGEVVEDARIWLKREDLHRRAGLSGAKVRTVWALATHADMGELRGLVTSGAPSSAQANVVARVARALGVPCRVHVPEGELGPELVAAREAGAEVVRHQAGYAPIVVARAREDAAERGWREVPFALECPEAVAQGANAWMRSSAPAEAKRVVVAVGSGMTLAGILTGMKVSGRRLPVLGVVVGADPGERLDGWAPAGWRDQVELVRSPLGYGEPHPEPRLPLGDGRRPLELDPLYEAKCLQYLRGGDLLWVSGIRQTAEPPPEPAPPVDLCAPRWVEGDARKLRELVEGKFDLVFSSPPYYDLERYSEDPADLSNIKTYAEFLEVLRACLAQAAEILRDDRFLVLALGEVRGPGGGYRHLVPAAVEACRAAGLTYYNEAVLVRSPGTAPLRAAPAFQAARKLACTHGSVLVFVKGDPARAAQACGPVEVGTEPEVAPAERP